MSPKNILAHYAKKVNDENADINPTPHIEIVKSEEEPVIYPAPHVKVVLAEENLVYDPAPNTKIVFDENTDEYTPHVEIVVDEEKTEIDLVEGNLLVGHHKFLLFARK